MQFRDVLEKRHSCREYSDREPEPEKLRAILDAANSAPSAGNLQAYRIYIVRQRGKKQDIMRAAYDQEFILQAPILLVFCADTDPNLKYGERGASLYSIQDATIAASYAQLAAAENGLGTVWVGAFDPLEVSRIIGADEYEVPVAIFPLGYPVDEPEARERKSMDDITKEV